MNILLDHNQESPTPLPSQVAFFNDLDNFHCGLRGGRGSGKTFICLTKLLALHIRNGIDKHGYPQSVPSCIVAQNYSAVEKVIKDQLSQVCKAMNLEWFVKSPASGAHRVVFPQLSTPEFESRIYITSVENDKLKNIVGWELGAAYIDEANFLYDVEETLNIVEPGIRHKNAHHLQLLISWSPEQYRPGNVAIEDWFQEGLKGRKKYVIKSTDNPHVARRVNQMVETLTPDRLAQAVYGEYIPDTGGLAYPYFSNANVKPATYRHGLPVCVSFDFNTAPAMFCIIGQYDKPNDTFYVFDEVKQGGELKNNEPEKGELRKCLAMLKDKLVRLHCNEVQIFGDASGFSGSALSTDSAYQIIKKTLQDWRLFEFRVRVPKKNPRVRDRIDAVNIALADVNHKTKVFIDPSCANLIADLKATHVNDKGEIMKTRRYSVTSHCSDAMGYWIWYLSPVKMKDDPTAIIEGKQERKFEF